MPQVRVGSDTASASPRQHPQSAGCLRFGSSVLPACAKALVNAFVHLHLFFVLGVLSEDKLLLPSRAFRERLVRQSAGSGKSGNFSEVGASGRNAYPIPRPTRSNAEEHTDDLPVIPHVSRSG